MKLIWSNEAVAANVSNKANASNSDEVEITINSSAQKVVSLHEIAVCAPTESVKQMYLTINWELNPEVKLDLLELKCLARADVAFGNQTTDATIN